MGYAIAEDAAARGAKVILVSGPVAIPEPPVEVIHVQTAAQMFDAVMKHLKESTIIVKAAAVADYHRADAPAAQGRRKPPRACPSSSTLRSIFSRSWAGEKEDRLLIGFAAETENLIGEARRKLESKNCDMVVANLVFAIRHRFRCG